MSQRETRNGLNVLTSMEIGTPELQWWQAEMQERAAFERRARLALPGWFGARRAGPNGAGRYGWQIVEDGTTGNLKVQTVYGAGAPFSLGTKEGNQITPPRLAGVLPNGELLEFEFADDTSVRDDAFAKVLVPDDATWYTLVATRITETYEPGFLLLTQGSTTIDGLRTSFTRYCSVADDPVPTVLRIDAADSGNGNEGTYEIQAITDDETITVSPAPPGADENVRFSVRGRFFVEPDPGESVDSQRSTRIAWELRARLVEPPADALVAYDCFRTGGTLTLIDRRPANEYRRMPDPADCKAVRLHPQIHESYAGVGSLQLQRSQVESNLGSSAVLELDIAPCAITKITGSGTDYNGMLLVHVETDGIHSKRAQSAMPTLDASTGWAFESEALAIAQVGITGVSLEQMPGGDSGYTHALAYSEGGQVRMARSVDNGATWNTDGVVWNPAGAHTAHSPALLWTTWGRLLLAAVYDDGAGGVTIRYVFSDDYGDTWDTGVSNAGYTAVSGTVDPRDLELVQDGFGAIVGVYIENAADELWVWHGTSPIDPTLDSEKAQVANRGAKILDSSAVTFGGASLGQPRAIAFSDGTVAIGLGSVTAGPEQYVLLVHIKYDEVLWCGVESEPDPAGSYAGASRPPVFLDQSNTGSCFLGYMDTDATALGDMWALHYVPSMVDISPSWAGGR